MWSVISIKWINIYCSSSIFMHCFAQPIQKHGKSYFIKCSKCINILWMCYNMCLYSWTINCYRCLGWKQLRFCTSRIWNHYQLCLHCTSNLFQPNYNWTNQSISKCSRCLFILDHLCIFVLNKISFQI